MQARSEYRAGRLPEAKAAAKKASKYNFYAFLILAVIPFLCLFVVIVLAVFGNYDLSSGGSDDDFVDSDSYYD